ncbi:hypothetical protein ACE14D_21765, partial [Streptomyces sp. Act-28]
MADVTSDGGARAGRGAEVREEEAGRRRRIAAWRAAVGIAGRRPGGGVHQDPRGRGATGDHMALTARVGGEGW